MVAMPHALWREERWKEKGGGGGVIVACLWFIDLVHRKISGELLCLNTSAR